MTGCFLRRSLKVWTTFFSIFVNPRHKRLHSLLQFCFKTPHKLCSRKKQPDFIKERTTHHHQRELLPTALVIALLDSFRLPWQRLYPQTEAHAPKPKGGLHSEARVATKKETGEAQLYTERRRKAAAFGGRRYSTAVGAYEPTLKTKTPTHSITALP